MNIVQPQTLDRLFADRSARTHIDYDGACQICGDRLRIAIDRLRSGYGLLGGVLFEVAPGQFLAQCARCYHQRQNPPENDCRHVA